LSLATQTPFIDQVEKLLGSAHHAGTFSKIKQHAPVAQLYEGVDVVAKDPAVDTLISVGGGSLTHHAKAMSCSMHQKTGGCHILDLDTYKT